ncbi:MAG: CpcT/CpeT family chromophore lyase [Rhodospirillaceae bacterium]|nr:CpcT/CpeT family chromophore lyase [Rhodospirillaceae bacterium]
MRTGLITALALVVGLLPGAPARATNSEVELKHVLKDLMAWLPGEYSSAPQVYFETAVGPPPDGVHENLYRIFAKIDAPHLGEHVIYTQLHIEGKRGPIFAGQQVVFIITVDNQRHGVNVSGRRIKDPDQYIDAHLHPEMWTTIAPDPDYGGNCNFLWRRHGAQLVAKLSDATQDDKCTMVSKRSGDQLTWDAEWVLNDKELWIHDNGYMKDGSLFAGRADKTHLRMTKVREYECLFGYRPAKGEPQVLNGPRMHDGGDAFVWELKDSPPRKVFYELMRGMWPSESGRNYAELIRISLYEGDPENDPEKNKLLGFGWASADSDRASFGTGAYNGRCKLYDPSAPPPKNE